MRVFERRHPKRLHTIKVYLSASMLQHELLRKNERSCTTNLPSARHATGYGALSLHCKQRGEESDKEVIVILGVQTIELAQLKHPIN